MISIIHLVGTAGVIGISYSILLLIHTVYRANKSISIIPNNKFKHRRLENEVFSRDVIFSRNHSPKWVKDYLDWHEEKKNNGFKDKSLKFLILTCHRDMPCGGLSDRLRSLPYFLLAAYKTNRVLLIHWGRYKLEDFLIPPSGGIDWRLPKNIVPKFPARQISCKNYNGPFQCYDFWENDKFVNEKAVFINAREDLYGDFEEEYFSIPHRIGLFRIVFDLFFEPTPPLLNQIKETKDNLGLANKYYVSAHVRSNYPSIHENSRARMTDKLRKRTVERSINCALSIQGENDAWAQSNLIYLSSDKSANVDFALHESKFSKKDSPVKVVGLEDACRKNLDQFHANYSRPDLMYPIFVDMWLMRESTCVSYGEGGFGLFGARLSKFGCTFKYQKSFSWNLNSCPEITRDKVSI